MRAILLTAYGEADLLHLVDLSMPEPGHEELLIRVEAAGVNFADIMLRKGAYPPGGTPPVVPGLEAAGTVARVGTAVDRFRVGDRVTALLASGAYAEYVVAREELTWAVPDDVDLLSAAAVPVAGLTAYNLLTLAGGLSPGESVLVHSAAGGVGSLAAQLARTLGAGLVIGTVGTDAKISVAAEAGCDHVIDRSASDIGQRVVQLTGGRGVDLILDGLAGEAFGSSLGYLAEFGRLVVYGMSTGQPGIVRSDLLHSANKAVLGYSTTRHRISRPRALAPAGRAVLEHLEKGELRPLIAARFPLSAAADAHRWIESGTSVGKALLLPV